MKESQSFEFKTAVPRVVVADVSAAVVFYTEKLCFDLWFEEKSEGCRFASIGIDSVEIHIMECFCEDQRHVGQQFFEIRVQDIEVYYELLKSRSVEFRNELTKQEWGQSTFQVTDPEGNWLYFASPFESRSAAYNESRSTLRQSSTVISRGLVGVE